MRQGDIPGVSAANLLHQVHSQGGWITMSNGQRPDPGLLSDCADRIGVALPGGCVAAGGHHDPVGAQPPG